MEQSAGQHKDAVSRSEYTIAISAAKHTLCLRVHVVNMTCPGLPSTSSPIKTDHNHTFDLVHLWPLLSSSLIFSHSASSFTYFSCEVSFSLLYYLLSCRPAFYYYFFLSCYCRFAVTGKSVLLLECPQVDIHINNIQSRWIVVLQIKS